MEKIADVPDVDIAEAGCFKYILIEVRDRASTHEQSKHVVRGDASCAFHGRKRERERVILSIDDCILADVLDLMQDQIDERKLILDCKGGGRIRVDPQTRKISVYGYSMVSD